ncbi:TPA: SLC5 family protein [Escherichia coli]|nr:SLC5 family protein [Escherichia coli]
MNSLQILSFVGFTLLVAVITWWKVRKTDTGSQQGYFLAGRSLKAPVIAASLMLTNLSTEQLVGLSGQAYKSGMSVMGWEVTSAVTLIFLALIFLPRYLKRGIATIPDFLEERYDKTTRIIIDFCFLIATGVCFLPIVLYSGALALNSLFHVGESLQISHGAAIWLLVILLGLAGILYAVISTFNGFLNSASTLFSMGIYRRIINQNAEPQQLVTVGRKFGFFIAIVSVLVAPWIANAPQGLYSWMKQLNGIYNVPLVTIIIMGFFFPRIPALAAKVAMGIGIISYITINYLVKFDFHFLYVLACTFCINVVVMLVIGFIKPRATPFTFKDAFAVDMKPWRNVKIASIGILFAMIGVYAGLAEFGGYGTRWLAMISYFIAAVVIVYLIFDSWRHRHDPAVTFTPDAKDSL